MAGHLASLFIADQIHLWLANADTDNISILPQGKVHTNGQPIQTLVVSSDGCSDVCAGQVATAEVTMSASSADMAAA